MWRIKRIIVSMLLLSTFFISVSIPVEAAPGGNVTLSNVSPVNQSIAIEIIGNPPEDSGYVNLSVTITDGNGGTDAEFYLNISIDGGATYTNRLHQVNIGDGEYHQHETDHNHTNITYYWSVAYRDGSEPFKTEFFHYRAEAKPNPPTTPTPLNGTMFEAGENATLTCVVSHPDSSIPSPPVMNVTFHEYPSGRVIGYDNSSLSDGATATCDSVYVFPDTGTKYYWYATATDDEFTSNNSAWWYVDTWYNDSEPSDAVYTTGGDIWVEDIYTGSEPAAAWYTCGGEVEVYSIATFNNPVPADDAVDQWINLVLQIDVNTSTEKYKDFKMRPNGGTATIELNITNGATNWDCVDEEVADDAGTYVYTDNNASYESDIYRMPNHTVAQHGDQLNVSIYFRCRNNSRAQCGNPGTGSAKPVLNFSGNKHYGDVKSLVDAWTTYAYMWDLNPETSAEWTWDDIDNLEAGISMIGGDCTQLFINVTYRQSITLLTTQFYTNDTVDGRWEQIGVDIPEQRTNYTALQGFSGLQFGKDYWWRVRVYNDTVGQYQNSSDYHFKTMSPPGEPETTWYTTGGVIWVEDTYTDSEPTTVWYTMGGNISVYYSLVFSNESPVDGATGQWKNGVLAVNVSQGGTRNYYDFTFYTNDSQDGSWKAIGSALNIRPNQTVRVGYGDFQWNRQYWWKVTGVNETLGQSENSSIWSFRTNYTIEEPATTWYTTGGVIWVEDIYTGSEPNTIWYTLGGQILLGAPSKPTDPHPADGTEIGKHAIPNFSCYVEDPQGYQMNVSFYWGDDTLIGTDTYVANGTRASIPVGWLTNYSWYSWYAVADNDPDAFPGGVSTESDLWWYLPGNKRPNVTMYPEEGDIHVPVRRMLVGGAYQNFVRLTWDLADNESDIMEFNCHIDDPAIGNWDDWISRWHIYDAQNGSYRQDEMLFDQPITDYHWKLYVADPYNETTYYANFSTEFYFWADYSWIPERATNDDTVSFIDESQNATDYWWYINGLLVANASGIAADEQFNMTYQFNISNVYNVTQTIYNESARVYDSMTRYIYIDRNVSLDPSALSVVVFHGQGMKDDMDVSELCTLLGITSDAWAHIYNPALERWISYWIDYPGLTDDFSLSQWDAFAFALASNVQHRINISDSPDQREAYFSRTAALENTSDANQVLTLPAGLNYVCWSNVSQTTPSSSVYSIGLDTGDTIYLYNTSTDAWSFYLVGSGGTDFEIIPYSIIVFYLSESRTITIEDGF